MESIEKKGLFKELNAVISRDGAEELLRAFKIDSYIWVSGYFISPFSLVSIKRGLKQFLVSWEMSDTGWRFNFENDAYVHFRGTFSSQIKDGKILYIKINTAKVDHNSEVHYSILTRYFKCLDTFYFMVTSVDDGFEILTNPLGASRGWRSTE
ncbi:hypothetical protein NEMIN01_0400 [Nematocida minor]|uniref:uncharacterized protein n=1 Tax=Nematocida minor TaxID=1912983 RepID=UPI00221EF817|nr:uncharacterized protein NEMIN01_0400 [Nematocida minor]KAI5189234.1 hypothetical protein NEMIN01_0400 [Nematocida minor]